ARRFSCQHDSVDSVQNGFSFPKLTTERWLALTPAWIKSSRTVLARLSPRARLYSVEPRSSACPSMRIWTFALEPISAPFELSVLLLIRAQFGTVKIEIDWPQAVDT